MGGFFDVEGKALDIKTREQEAASDGFWSDQAQAQKKMSELAASKNIVSKWNELRQGGEDILAHLELAKELGEGEEAQKECDEIDSALTALEKKFSSLDIESKLSEEFDRSNAIVSLHSGAGGTEACDWVSMLFRMLTRWADQHDYTVEVSDMLSGDEAGIKSVTFFVKGLYAYGYLKSEMGVHRLVRVSPFDANKRRHTSFASCDVLPEIDENIEITINEADLRVDTYRSGGAGGQHVNKTDSAVRLTHLPTGIVVASQTERSQIKNRITAMKLLKARLYEHEKDKQRAAAERHYDEKGDIAWGNQIRSYVFMPYQLVKDMRTGYETGNVEAVMDGAIDDFMYAYLSGEKVKK